MHGYIYNWLARTLLLAILCASVNAVTAQDGWPTTPYVATPVTDAIQPMPIGQPYAGEYYSTANAAVDNSDLAQRLAEVEKALKKIDGKAAADKEKAANKMSLEPFGRIFLDTASFTQDAVDKARFDEQNGIEFRTARLGLQGAGFDIMKYKIEFDFALERVRAKDVYMNIGELPLLQNIQIGYFKEPFSLDELTSSRYITFMERSTPGILLAPSRHYGVMAHGHTESENATYAVGAFAERKDAAVVQDDVLGGALTMRGTWLPWCDEATNGRGLLHTGIAYSYRDAFENQWTYAYRPESYLAHETSFTVPNVDTRNMLGMELALVYGPFSMQSEYYINWVDRLGGLPNFETQGAYVYFSYFLTGENRPYNRHSGVFDRVKPFENFFRVRDENGYVHMGKGAWELKYRYSYLDGYDDGLIGIANASTVSDHTLGMNWYLNPYTRFMFEYIHSGINIYTGLGQGDLNIFQMRAQIDF